MEVQELLAETNYLVELNEAEPEPEQGEGVRVFVASLPIRELADDESPSVILYNSYHDGVLGIHVGYPQEDPENGNPDEGWSYSTKLAPTYIHRLMIFAHLSFICDRHGFSPELLKIGTEFVEWGKGNEKEQAVKHVLNTYKSKNNWRSRRLAKKLGVLDGFLALYNFYGDMKSA